MKPLIVADSSPLIALLNIEEIGLLQKLFSTVIVPAKVKDEVELGLNKDSIWYAYKQQGFISVRAAAADPRLVLLNLQLDPGESEAILLADQLDLPLMIDEKAGRKMAKSFGLEVRGLVGVMYALKQNGTLSTDQTADIVAALENVNFRMSNTLKALLLEK